MDKLINVDKLKELFGDNLDLLHFYLLWVKNGLDAGEAYHELHPDVDRKSANTLGSRLLKKVDRDILMEAYGLNEQDYFSQLKDGMKADKWNDFTGEREPDHKTRLPYHTKLGKLLKLESDAPTLAIQNNFTFTREDIDK